MPKSGERFICYCIIATHVGLIYMTFFWIHLTFNTKTCSSKNKIYGFIGRCLNKDSHTFFYTQTYVFWVVLNEVIDINIGWFVFSVYKHHFQVNCGKYFLYRSQQYLQEQKTLWMYLKMVHVTTSCMFSHKLATEPLLPALNCTQNILIV